MPCVERPACDTSPAPVMSSETVPTSPTTSAEGVNIQTPTPRIIPPAESVRPMSPHGSLDLIDDQLSPRPQAEAVASNSNKTDTPARTDYTTNTDSGNVCRNHKQDSTENLSIGSMSTVSTCTGTDNTKIEESHPAQDNGMDEDSKTSPGKQDQTVAPPHATRSFESSNEIDDGLVSKADASAARSSEENTRTRQNSCPLSQNSLSPDLNSRIGAPFPAPPKPGAEPVTKFLPTPLSPNLQSTKNPVRKDHRRARSCQMPAGSENILFPAPRRNPFEAAVQYDVMTAPSSPYSPRANWMQPPPVSVNMDAVASSLSPSNITRPAVCMLAQDSANQIGANNIMMSPPQLPTFPDKSVILGVQQLERQQAELEARQASSSVGKAVSILVSPMPQIPLPLTNNNTPVQMNTNTQLHNLQSTSAPPLPFTGNLEFFNGGAVAPAPNYSVHTSAMQSPPYFQNRELTLTNNSFGYVQNSQVVSEGGPEERAIAIHRSSSFSRFLPQRLRGSFSGNTDDISTSTRKSHQMLSSGGNSNLPPPIESKEEDGMWRDQVKPLVYGYLHKRTRNGVWQRRFFETDGECLTYYKTQKRSKLLATLDLVKVGVIAVDETDPTGCNFTIQVAGRPYFLRADDSATCKDWVINLNRVREARVQIGGIKLVTPHYDDDDDDHPPAVHRKRSESTEYAARIVMVANRQRSHAIDDDNDECLKQMASLDTYMTGSVASNDKDLQRTIDEKHLSPRGSYLMPTPVSDFALPNQQAGASPAGSASTAPASTAVTERNGRMPHFYSRHSFSRSARLGGHIPPELLARWQKRRTNFQLMRGRLARLVRWMGMMRCDAKAQDDVIVGLNSMQESEDYPMGMGLRSFTYGEEGTTADNSEMSSSSGLKHPQAGGEVVLERAQSGSFEGNKSHSAWIGKEQQLHLRGSTSGSAKNSFRSLVKGKCKDINDRVSPKNSHDEAECVDFDAGSRTLS